MVRRRSATSLMLPAEASVSYTDTSRNLRCDEGIKLSTPLVDSFSPQDDATAFGRSGHILSKTSASSKLLRKWQASFWVHLRPATLVIFRSEEDFHAWVVEQQESIDHQSYQLALKSRRVVLFIDFDTFGILQGRDTSLRGVNCNNLLTSSKAGSSKLISSFKKYSLGDVETSKSPFGTNWLLSFKLERFTNVGVDVVASYASTDPDQLRSLRRVIHDCIKITSRQKRARATSSMTWKQALLFEENMIQHPASMSFDGRSVDMIRV